MSEDIKELLDKAFSDVGCELYDQALNDFALYMKCWSERRELIAHKNTFTINEILDAIDKKKQEFLYAKMFELGLKDIHEN